MEDTEVLGTFWDHLEELRKTLIGILAIIITALAFSLFYYQPLLSILQTPLTHSSNLNVQQLNYHRISNPTDHIQVYRVQEKNIEILPGETIDVAVPSPLHSLVVLSPLEGMMTTLKICFWFAIVISSPFWLFLLMRFIAPALHNNYRSFIPIFICLSFGAITLGMLFAYYITLPISNKYLYTFNLEIGQNLWSLAHYFDYTVLLLLGNGLAVEIALMLFFLVHFGIFTSQMLISKRRHMIVAAFIIAAILTPPDILTQFLLAIPLILLYEASILYARIRVKI
jgi:sec-independent protein translocase protein TatC